MGEPRRVSLTQLGSSRKDKKAKETPKTYRFVLTLTESNELSCPEFSYAELVRNRLKREAAREDKKDEAAHANGMDLDVEEDAKLRGIARHFEEKYGGKKPRCGRFEDYVDLGAGYDENDTFIDNTDAYDEIVPEDVTTAHGGFYINSGALEFKRVEISDQSDESQEVKSKKRRKQRIVSDDEQESEEEAEEEMPKRAKLESDADRLYLKQMVKDGGLIRKKKKAIDGLVKRKKAFTVKALLQQKREREGKAGSDDEKRMASISAAIESVVSAARPVSPEELSSGSLDGSESEDNTDTGSTHETILPDSLPVELRDTIASLKTAAKESAEGKCRFFSPEVNRMLLVTDRKSRELSCAQRQMVFSHLAHYLPCTKDTLLKRAKKLVIEAAERKLSEPLQKLREAITKDGILSESVRVLLCEVARSKAQCYEVSKSRKESAEEYIKSFLAESVVPLWPESIDANELYVLSQDGHRHITSKLARRNQALAKRVASPVETPALSPPIHVKVEKVESSPVTPSVTPTPVTVTSVTPSPVPHPKPILDGELSKEIVVTPVTPGAPKLDLLKVPASTESESVGSVLNTGSVTVTVREVRVNPAEVARHQPFGRTIATAKPAVTPIVTSRPAVTQSVVAKSSVCQSVTITKTPPPLPPASQQAKPQPLVTKPQPLVTQSSITKPPVIQPASKASGTIPIISMTQSVSQPIISKASTVTQPIITLTQPVMQPNVSKTQPLMSIAKTQPAMAISKAHTAVPVAKPQPVMSLTKTQQLPTQSVTVTKTPVTQPPTSKPQPPPVPAVTKPTGVPIMADMLSQIIRNTLVGYPSGQPSPKPQQSQPEYRKPKQEMINKAAAARASPTVIVTSSGGWSDKALKKPEEDNISVEQEVNRVVQRLCEISGQNKSDVGSSSSQVHTITHGSAYSRPMTSTSIFSKGSLSVSLVDKPAVASQPSPKSVSLKQDAKAEEDKWRTQLASLAQHSAPPAHTTAAHELPGAFYSFQDAFHKHLQANKDDEPPLNMAISSAGVTVSRLNTSPNKSIYSTGLPATSKLPTSSQYPSFETSLAAHSTTSPSSSVHQHHHPHHQHHHHHHHPHHHSSSSSHHTSPSSIHSSLHSSTPSPHHHNQPSHAHPGGSQPGLGAVPAAGYLGQKPGDVLRHVLPSQPHSGMPSFP